MRSRLEKLCGQYQNRPGSYLSRSAGYLIDAFLLAVLFGTPAVLQAAQVSSPPSQKKVAPVSPGKNVTPPKSPKDTPAAIHARRQADPPTNTFSVDAFQTDLFTGAATAEIPIERDKRETKERGETKGVKSALGS